MLEDLTHERCAKCLNQTFRVSHEDRTLELELIETKKLGPDREDGGRAPFSLVFRGPGRVLLPQAIHQVANDELGTLQIFLVPLGPREESLLYEAIFT